MSIPLTADDMQATVVQFDYENAEVREFYAEIEQQADVITYNYRYQMGLLIQQVVDMRGRDEALAWAKSYLGKSQPTVYRYLQVAHGENPYPQLAIDEAERRNTSTILNIGNSAIDSDAFMTHQMNGGNEYYTPGYIMERVRAVLGEINLDPASCEQANQTVQAQKFFTENDDGLAQEWYGRVFLNPPFNSKPRQGVWAARLLQCYQAGEISEAILLCGGNAKYTDWWVPFSVFPRAELYGKVRFDTPDGPAGTEAPFATILVYLGHDLGLFVEQFEDIADLVHVERVVTPEEKETTARPDIASMFADDEDEEESLPNTVDSTTLPAERYTPGTVPRGDGQVREPKVGSSREQAREAKQAYNMLPPLEKAEAIAKAKPVVEDAPTLEV